MKILEIVFPQNKLISKEVLTLSYPIILSNLSRVLMSILDLVMVGHLGVAAIAATGMGGMVLWGALSVVLGIRTAVQTVTSRRCVAKALKPFLNLSIWVCLSQELKKVESIKDLLAVNPKIMEREVRLLELALLQIELVIVFYIPFIKQT